MKEKREDRNNFVSSFAMGLFNIPFSTIANGLGLYLFTIVYNFRIFTINGHSWPAWLFLFFADEFSYYWFHRMSHQARFLWASHQVHHSSQKFTLTSGLRVPWTGGITGSFLFWVWLPFIGIQPYMIFFIKSAGAIYQFWLHTETIHRMPKWYEAFFNTPSHHRVHHSSDIMYLDKNFAGNLIIFDKLFGTYQEEIFKPKYGLTSDIHSSNPFVIELDEWKNLLNDLKKSKRWKDRFHYLFDSPGWSADGKSNTTKQLQKKSATENEATFLQNNHLTNFENTVNQQKRHFSISKKTLLFLLLVIAFHKYVPAQDKSLYYDVVRNGNVIGCLSYT